MSQPKVSIVTVVFNGRETIEDAIQSVLTQTYPNIEYIVVDGKSTDGTLDIVNKYRDKISKIISGKDNGIYDAMNKGIRLTTGDIIGTLNADDFYADNDIIEQMVRVMESAQADVAWGDLVYVKDGNRSEIVRVWQSSSYEEGKFRKGWMPPHPTFFVKKSVYQKYGFFNTDFKISADYELMLRLLEKYRVKSVYIPKVMVKMRTGGKSGKSILNIGNIIRYKTEDYRAWKINGLGISFVIVFLKPLSKITQYFK